MSEVVVLDASAILALLQSEPGAERVGAALPQAVVSSVNLSEVMRWSPPSGQSDKLGSP